MINRQLFGMLYLQTSPHIWLVVWNMAFMTFHILGIIMPTDVHIFQRGWNHQPVLLVHVHVFECYIVYFCLWRCTKAGLHRRESQWCSKLVRFVVSSDVADGRWKTTCPKWFLPKSNMLHGHMITVQWLIYNAKYQAMFRIFMSSISV